MISQFLLVELYFFDIYSTQMDFTEFTAGTDDSKRLDKIIRKFVPEITLSEVYKFIRKGLIKINQKKCSPEYHVQPGDIICIASFIIQNQSSSKPQTNIKTEKLPVIFQNEHILILDKPYDITVQGDENSLDKLVQNNYINNKCNNSLTFTPGPLHRLDRKTTGLIAFSQSLIGAQWFSKNIQNHIITKKYFAVLQGKVTQNEEWIDYISKPETSVKNKEFHKVNASKTETENAKKAHTIIKPITFGKYDNSDFTLAEIEIKTGRTHQIRSQSSLHNHPLFGDEAYGGKKLAKKYPDFFLQAYKLTFPKDNPIGLPETVEIPYSLPLKNFLKDCDVEILDI